MTEYVSAHREAVATAMGVLVLAFASMGIRLSSEVDLEPKQMLFVFSNAAIVAGYGFVAVRVTPVLPVRKLTRYGATAFFLLCALTHMDQIVHTLGDRSETWGHITQQGHMLFIHVPQAVAVWIFAIGFFLDLDRLRRERKSVAPAVYRAEDDDE